MTREESAPERLNRYLSRAGVGSRRRADQLILEGRVGLNGSIVDTPATRVRPGVDVVTLDDKVLVPPDVGEVWIVFNKPAGILTARRDMRGRPTLFDALPKQWRNLIPVGRLDIDTEGVVLLTSDGLGANRLMHPRYQIERVYEATVAGSPLPATLRGLARGIDLGDPTPARALAHVTRRHSSTSVVRLSLREGRKREVKRMMRAIGHPVRKLKRVSFAGITVRGLGPGEWRQLTAAEIGRLQGLPLQAEGRTGQGGKRMARPDGGSRQTTR